VRSSMSLLAKRELLEQVAPAMSRAAVTSGESFSMSLWRPRDTNASMPCGCSTHLPALRRQSDGSVRRSMASQCSRR
jgi:hypothetical protein